MITLKNIDKTYLMGEVAVQALQGVSLSIDSGEFVAIMGPSGSGKSTLMHMIGLLDRPDKGEYFIGQKKVSQLSDEDLSAVRNRLVGFVFQQFHLLPRVSALDNAALPLIYAGKKHLRENARERLTEVGLAARVHHQPNELSGGQQQRVAIARALVNDPAIILADEPTGNLDSKSKEEIMGILKSLHDRGKTVVIVTHENEVSAQAKRIITMRDGQIISDEKKEMAKHAARADGQGQDIQTDKIIETVLSHAEKTSRETKFLDYFHQAVGAMTGHKMRSFLSILGILIGVAAVIAMLAIGQGAKESIEKQLSSLGSNLLMARPGSSKVRGVSMEAGSTTRLTFSDVAAIAKLTDVVKRVSPSVRGRGQLVYKNKNWNTQVEGVSVDFAEIRNAVPPVGRFFTEEEVRRRDKVVLLGPTVARELFGEENPVGESIKINLNNFKVTGVLPSKGGNSFHDQDDTVVIPVTTAMYRVFGKEYIDSLYIEATGPEALDQAEKDIAAVLKKQHRLPVDEDDAFQIRNMADMKNALESTTKTMSLLLGSIAAISLLVGGISCLFPFPNAPEKLASVWQSARHGAISYPSF